MDMSLILTEAEQWQRASFNIDNTRTVLEYLGFKYNPETDEYNEVKFGGACIMDFKVSCTTAGGTLEVYKDDPIIPELVEHFKGQIERYKLQMESSISSVRLQTVTP